MAVARPFHVMAKPIGPVCDLQCKYCFYCEKTELFPSDESYRMSDEVLERFIRNNIRAQQDAPQINFAWQGGEPTLMGLDFFQKVVAIQRHYAKGRPVLNALQTNGTQLDERWSEFLAREHFLVGLSLDGPEHIHNRYRINQSGEGSFEKVMRGLECLKSANVEFNTLTCVTRQSPDEAVEVYNFLKAQGVRFMQFIPIVERVKDAGADSLGLDLAVPPDLRSNAASEKVTEWSVAPDGFGDFMISVFDEWVRADVGRIFVNLFDVAVGAWCGMEPGLCVFARKCGQSLVIEHDGGVYSCDHFVYPEFFLGNIMEKSLEEMVYSTKQSKFGADKQNALSMACKTCDYLFACNGDCPKHRFVKAAEGEPFLSYLCPGYKKFFKHVDVQMQAMVTLIKQGRPAAEIMRMK